MHYRYFFQVGKGKKVSTFTDFQLPQDDGLVKFMATNNSSLVGHTDTLYDIKVNEIINIAEVDYIYICSKKYYRKEEKSTKITLICELCFVQEVLYKEKEDENA